MLNLLPVRAREPADGESTAGLRRQAGARRTNSLVSVARPALVTRFAGLVSETGEGRGQILPFAVWDALAARLLVQFVIIKRVDACESLLVEAN